MWVLSDRTRPPATRPPRSAPALIKASAYRPHPRSCADLVANTNGCFKRPPWLLKSLHSLNMLGAICSTELTNTTSDLHLCNTHYPRRRFGKALNLVFNPQRAAVLSAEGLRLDQRFLLCWALSAREVTAEIGTVPCLRFHAQPQDAMPIIRCR